MTQIITFEEVNNESDKPCLTKPPTSGGINTNVPLNYCDLVPIGICTNLQFYYSFNLNVGESPNCRNDFSNTQIVIPPTLFNIPNGKAFNASYVLSPNNQITLEVTTLGFQRVMFLLLQAKCGDFYIGLNSDPLFRSKVYVLDATDLYSCCDDKNTVSYQSMNTLSVNNIVLKNYYPPNGIVLIDGSKIKDIRVQVIIIGF